MKILNNPEENSMICVLPNGVTVEVMQVSLTGTQINADQNVDEVLNVMKSLPNSMLSGSQHSIY